MQKYIAYSVFLLLLCYIGFSQDIIVKKDSTKTQAKILEVRPTEIKYKFFNSPDGPLYIVRKNDIAYVIYSNGTKEVFIDIKTPEENVVPAKPARKVVVGDYIKFNVQLGVVFNSLSSNYMRREGSSSQTSSEKYSASSNKYNYNLNLGFNVLCGNNPYIKHVIGINYLRSNGEYNYTFSQGGYTSYYQEFHYVSKIDFINVVTGVRIKAFKGLYIEPLVSVNIIAQADVRYSGTSTTKHIAGGPTPTVYQTDIEYFSNKKVDGERAGISSTISFCPRVSYEFNIKNQKLGVYVSYNLAVGYRLPWMMAGITYYPFKKLR